MHSGIVFSASAPGHSVTLCKAKRKGTLIGQCILYDDGCMCCVIFFRCALRDTQEECCALPLTHAKGSGHPWHLIDYTLRLHVVWSIIVCCMSIG